MRRNLRLDWRALALLGALLSIRIDWPGLVYAMPTILPPMAATAAEASPIDTLNTIKNDKTVSFLNDQPEAHKRFATMTPSLKQDIEMKLTQQQQQPPQQILQRITITNEKLKQQVNDNPNSIRKQQQINNENKQEQKTKNEIENKVVTTAIHQEENENSSAIPLAAAKYELESLPKVISSLENTHTRKNSTNKNTENNKFKSTTITSTLSPVTTTTPPTAATIATTTTTSTTIALATTESLVNIASTLMPTIIVETEAQAPPQQSQQQHHYHQQEQQQQQQEQFETSFKFSSSHHLAILSRTERSIRSSSSSSLSPSALKSSGGSSIGSRSSSSSNSRSSGVGSVVRRSSDMSVLKSKRLNNSRNLHQKNNLDRNERSTVSHLSGPSRKIQLYIKNRFIQLLPDGTVNGTQDEQCDYTILQRSTVEVGRIKIQGVATCLYLCMDPCGAVYGSKEFTDDCVFNESMEQHNYNTYSSTYNSNARRKYYLALNRHGEPRKLQIPPSRSLGKLATYTNAIPETVPQERVEQLIAKNFGANRVKHGIRQLCDTGKPLIELIDSKNFKARPKCNPNNSNNNSNSKNTLSRNIDKDNNSLLVSHNHQYQQHQQHQQHQHQQHYTNNNSNSNSNSNSNGQVPVANDKNLNNFNTNSRSSSSSSSSTSNTSSSSSSSISINQNNDGHISNSNVSNLSRHTNSSNSSSSNSSDSSLNSNNSSISLSSTSHNSHHRGGKKAGKKRKCRRFENEEQHNCTTPLNRPTSFTKRGNQLGPLRQQKCQNLLLQQQQAGVTDIVLPPMCTKKGGSKNKQQQGNKRAQGKNSLGTEGLGPNNRRGKKLNMNRGGNAGLRQTAKNQQQGGGSGANSNGTKKKQKNSKKGGPNNNSNGNKKNKKSNSNASSSTTEKTESTSTLKTKLLETTSLMPSTTLYDNYDPHGETTSDRGDREQRNVRYSNSMEEYMEQSSEDTSAGEDPEDDDNDMIESNDENNEDASYEDDSYISSSSHMPYAAAESSHTPLTAGADDFLYYDQLDL